MNLKSILESLLFISGEPVEIKKLARITGASQIEVENTLLELICDYKREDRGLRMLKKDGAVQMVTSSENAPYVEQLKESNFREDLSQAALETLAIVAYQGPVSRFDIEEIRGVNCTFILRNLLIRGLIERIENPQDRRIYLYRVTFDFLKSLGVERVEDLPGYEQFNRDDGDN